MRAATGTTPALLAVQGDLWVFNKPAGWLSHRCGNPERPDVMAWAKAHAGAPQSLSPVHRLDSGTSGVLLASPDAAVRGELGAAFAARTVTKSYWALVWGTVAPTQRIDAPLADARRGAISPAATQVRRLAELGRWSLVEAHPETGRKHQIRRHLRGIKRPIVGDRRYGWPQKRRVPHDPGRLWLHALRLVLPGGRVFEAPLAPELLRHLRNLGAPASAL